MNYTIIRANADGVSFFETAELVLETVELAPPAATFLTSAFTQAKEIGFMTIPAGWAGGWHNAPDPGFVIVLEGEMEIETGDGDRRRFPTGSVWQHRDFEGGGHNTTVVGEIDAKLIMVRLDE